MSVSETVNELIELKNNGPIRDTFSFEFNGPGLYELRGTKGSGKSTVLNSISLLSGSNVDMTLTDGEKEGWVKGFGRVCHIGSKKRPKGEFSAEVLEFTKYDLTDLIDPDGKTPETRDSTRIKALAHQCRMQLKPEDFYNVVGGQQAFGELGVEEVDDPVLYMSRVKKAIDELALDKEKASAKEKEYYNALLEQAKGIDLKAECDPAILTAAVDRASEKVTRIKESIRLGKQAEQHIAAARERLQAAQESYTGLPVQEARDGLAAWRQSLDEDLETKNRLERELAEAKEKLATTQGKFNEAIQKLEAAEQHEADIKQWEDALNIAEPVYPTQDDVALAEGEKTVALEAQENGVRVRDAKAAVEKAETHKKASIEAYEKSVKLRDAASNVFTVLTQKLNTTVIAIENVAGAPRLIVNHPKRKKTFYDQVDGLSDGERVKAALDELLPHLGSPGVFIIPQRIYQDLPPKDRIELGEYAAVRGVFAFGAQVTDEELNVVKVGALE